MSVPTSGRRDEDELIRLFVESLQDKETGAGSDMHVGEYDEDSGYLDILTDAEEDGGQVCGAIDVSQLVGIAAAWAEGS